MRVIPGLGAILVMLSGCAPPLPGGVTKAGLDAAITQAIGDPNTCVLIAQGGKVSYRYGTNVVCGRAWPSCQGSEMRKVEDLLRVAKTPATASCYSSRDGSRGVSWASGPVAGHTDLAYAAVMEGKSVPPGIAMVDKLAEAFKGAGF